MKKRIWNVLYAMVEHDRFQEPYIRILASYDSEEEAAAFLQRDYEKTLKGLKEGDTVYDVLSEENNGDNATVKLGLKSEGDPDYDEVECVHKWRVAMQTALIERPEVV